MLHDTWEFLPDKILMPGLLLNGMLSMETLKNITLQTRFRKRSDSDLRITTCLRIPNFSCGSINHPSLHDFFMQARYFGVFRNDFGYELVEYCIMFRIGDVNKCSIWVVTNVAVSHEQMSSDGIDKCCRQPWTNVPCGHEQMFPTAMNKCCRQPWTNVPIIARRFDLIAIRIRMFHDYVWKTQG